MLEVPFGIKGVNLAVDVLGLVNDVAGAVDDTGVTVDAAGERGRCMSGRRQTVTASACAIGAPAGPGWRKVCPRHDAICEHKLEGGRRFRKPPRPVAVGIAALECCGAVGRIRYVVTRGSGDKTGQGIAEHHFGRQLCVNMSWREGLGRHGMALGTFHGFAEGPRDKMLLVGPDAAGSGQ